MDMVGWIRENYSLYDDLTPGLIYVVFDREKPLLEDSNFIYKQVYVDDKGNITKKRMDKTDQTTQRRVSKKGNIFVTKIAICELCGTMRAARGLKKPTCTSCLHTQRNRVNLNRYYIKYRTTENFLVVAEVVKKCYTCKRLRSFCGCFDSCNNDGFDGWEER